MSRDRSGLLGEKKAEVHRTYGVLRQIYSLLRDWMSQIRAKVILFPKIELRTIRLPYVSDKRQVRDNQNEIHYYTGTFVFEYLCDFSINTRRRMY